MKTTILAAGAAAVTAAGLIAGAAYAHHSFAMFDSQQHKLIEGEVTEWNYNNPHSWLIVQAPGPDGAMTTWSFEGAAIVHAARQGVNGKSYAKGEQVRIVMHPLRDGRNAGALCFVIKEDGTLHAPERRHLQLRRDVRALAGEGLARVGPPPRHASDGGLTGVEIAGAEIQPRDPSRTARRRRRLAWQASPIAPKRPRMQANTSRPISSTALSSTQVIASSATASAATQCRARI